MSLALVWKRQWRKKPESEQGSMELNCHILFFLCPKKSSLDFIGAVDLPTKGTEAPLNFCSHIQALSCLILCICCSFSKLNN